MWLPVELWGGDDVVDEAASSAAAITMLASVGARKGVFFERGDSRGGVGGRGGMASMERRLVWPGVLGTPEKKGLDVGAGWTIIRTGRRRS